MSRKYKYTSFIGVAKTVEVQFCITWGHTVFHVSQMSKNHEFLSCKGWKMKVHKHFWALLALIHCYMPKH